MSSGSEASGSRKAPSVTNSLSFESSSEDEAKQSKVSSVKKNTPSRPKKNIQSKAKTQKLSGKLVS